MSIPDIINQFNFPPEARADFEARGLTQKRLQQNGTGTVSEFQLSGHDQGLGFRFFTHAVKNEMKSQEADMEINDDIHMIEWFKSKDEKPVERVHFLPEQLLKFKKRKVERMVMDGQGHPLRHIEYAPVFPLECVGGLYAEDYRRWLKGLSGQGLELSRWNKVTLGQAKTLNSEGIFTVEQLAAMDRSVVESRFPKDLKKAFQDAIHFCNAQAPLANAKEHAEKVLLLEQALSKERDARSELEARLAKLETSRDEKPAKAKRGRGRPRKNEVADVPEMEDSEDSEIDFTLGEEA